MIRRGAVISVDYSTLRFFFTEVYISIRRNLLMSIAASSTMMFSVLILGIFLLIISGLNFITRSFITQVDVIVFLKDGLSEKAIYELKNNLLSYPSVEAVHFVSKEEAFKRLEEKLGVGNLSGVRKNKLLNNIEVSVGNPEHIEEVASRAEKLSGVDHVKYGKDIVDVLIKFSRMVHLIGIAGIILITLITVIIVSNAVRLTIYARRKEIEIMQLVGATRWFIRWPFILEGLFYGFSGSAGSIILLIFICQLSSNFIFEKFPFLSMLPGVTPLMAIFLVFIGLSVGFLSSMISVGRFLKV